MRDIEKMIAEGNQAACDSRHDATAGEFMAMADGITDDYEAMNKAYLFGVAVGLRIAREKKGRKRSNRTKIE